MSLSSYRVKLSRLLSLVDLFLLFCLGVFLYALIGVASDWVGPYHPRTEIDLGFTSLVRYSFLSLVRVGIAYLLSLVFTFSYGYVAAKSRTAEPVLIPLLDILQSVPVLGFMPGLVLALVALFPNSNLGLELAAVIMIFTGQGWNMCFSFYSSLKSVPRELRDMTQVFRMNRWAVLTKVEIPYAMNGLLWNSMLSMAGGWFFLMVIESFTLGENNFRLPGIGSYMAVAYERSDTTAILAGIGTMFFLIILVDRCLWAPLVAWSHRFRLEGTASDSGSLVLDWLRRSRVLAWVDQWFENRRHQRAHRKVTPTVETSRHSLWARYLSALWKFLRLFGVVLVGMTVYEAGRSVWGLMAATPYQTWLEFAWSTLLTFLRVLAAVVLGSLWTIPVGVFIGTKPKWTRRMQPVVQVVASFPAPMLYPLITALLLWAGVNLQFGAIVLMIFASQWYILFNVISGATLIPRSMLDLASVFRVGGWRYWTSIILPAIFPSLVNGWITAAGGAWNASIVSEYVVYRGTVLEATGIGADITRAAGAGNYPALAAGIFMMVTTVVLLNRALWGTLYKMAEGRFQVETIK